jgi:hypothetical protein
MYHPFGVVKEEWFPEGLGSGFSLEGKKSSAPLQAIRDDIIMFSNIDNAVGEKNECANFIDQHHAAVSSLWTGGEMDGGPAYCGEPSDSRFNTCTRPRPSMPSIDSVIAQHMLPDLHHDQVVANLGVRSTDFKDGHVHWLHQKVDGTTVVAENDPRAAFAALFGADSATLVEQPRPFTGLKDAIREDLLLFEQRLALPERERFQLYMESFDAYERSLETELSFENLCQALPDEPNFEEPFDAVGAENIWPLCKAQVDLAVLALSCGARRIATLHLTDGFATYYVPKGPFDRDGAQDGHNLSHHTAGSNPYELRTNLNFYHSELFVRLVNGLKAAPNPADGASSLFDDTVALWASGQSGDGGGGHSKMRVPVTVAAGRSAGWVMGRHMDAGFGTVTMLWRSVCNTFGMPDQPFGVEEFCPEPLAGLDTDVEVAGNYDRVVLQYTDGTARCRTHVQ